MENITNPEILQTVIWSLVGIMFLFVSIFGFVAKYAINSVLTKMDEFLDEVRTLTNTSTKHDETIKGLQKSEQNQDTRLNSHSEQIRRIDKDLATCQSKHVRNVPV